MGLAGRCRRRILAKDACAPPRPVGYNKVKYSTTIRRIWMDRHKRQKQGRRVNCYTGTPETSRASPSVSGWVHRSVDRYVFDTLIRQPFVDDSRDVKARLDLHSTFATPRCIDVLVPCPVGWGRLDIIFTYMYAWDWRLMIQRGS